ncbi:acylphosphatase [Chromobacterium alticapitis]|uniref:acylphosphatase n=1 Tax=Chromobacterium alticapitis TaxID=2073169 RepID=A0A2S5DC20_9NEIS|nr:acylphosphatase [Chromobacterium alticapitis]POZ60619.1 hypothetical protein C2I19_17920 [Chromobacterium alticapitis]
MPRFPLILASALLALGLASAAQAAGEHALDGTASGKVQKVGFRALILKQAIQNNLAGTARNTDEQTVLFSLQGKDKRIQDAVDRLKRGTDKSEDVKIATKSGPIVPGLHTFTVVGWTSLSRGITHPYDLVFTLRADGSKVSKAGAKQTFCDILKNTLQPADWQKAAPRCQAAGNAGEDAE